MRQKHTNTQMQEKAELYKILFTYLIHAENKKNGLRLKLEIAEGLEITIMFSVVSTQPNLSGFKFYSKIKYHYGNWICTFVSR